MSRRLHAGALWSLLTLAVGCDDGAASRSRERAEHVYATSPAGPGVADATEDAPTDTVGDADDTTIAPDTSDEPDATPDTIDTSDTSPPDPPETSDTSDTTDTRDTADTAPDTRPPDPAPQTLAPATLAAIDAAMQDVLADPGLDGSRFGGFVLDLETDQVVWQEDADGPLIPASNTKVFTTGAALDLLGEDHRMLSRVFSDGDIVGGALTAALDLHGEHDFTWSRWFYADEREPLERLADALWNAGLREIGDVGVWGAYLYDGHHFGSYDPATHRQRAGDAFIAALEARGISVGGTLVDHATMALPPGRELARWESIPLQVGAWAINRRSHNEMADILARHLGWIEGGASDYPTGDAVIAAWLADAGVDASGFELYDGSGLAVENRVSARQLVGVYRYLSTTAVWPSFLASLSVAGSGGPASVDGNDEAIVTENTAPFNGTLASRMSGDDTAGRVYGKSGTNAGITTSGVLYSRWDGHRYAFAFLMNELSSYDVARVTQDALVAVIAGHLEDRGALPAAPTLGCVRASGGVIEVAVSAVAGLDLADPRSGYRFEMSRDGKTWLREDSIFDQVPRLELPARSDAGATVYVRARVESPAGPSEPSDAYPVRAFASGARVLLVDADDRWQRQPTNENLRGAAHAFMTLYGAAMPAGHGIDTCPNEALADGSVDLAAYDVVAWATGEEAATDESFDATEAALVADYLAQGGALFASGAEIGWDLDPSGNASATANDRAFYESWLGARYAGDDAGVFVVEGVAGGIFDGLTHDRRLGFWTPGQIFVAYPDELLPLGDAAPCLRYLGPGTVACVQGDDPRVVTFGFPFESLDGAAERALVMQRVLAFLLR